MLVSVSGAQCTSGQASSVGGFEVRRRRSRRARSARGASPRSSGSSRPASTPRASGTSMILTSSTVVRPPRPCAPMPSALTLSYSSMRSSSIRFVRAARVELVHVDRLHQRFLRHQHRLLGGAADADAEHARRAPAGAHRRHGLQHPVDDRVRRVEHRELATCSREPPPLAATVHVDLVAGHELDVDHGRRVVLRVLALELRVGRRSRRAACCPGAR